MEQIAARRYLDLTPETATDAPAFALPSPRIAPPTMAEDALRQKLAGSKKR